MGIEAFSVGTKRHDKHTADYHENVLLFTQKNKPKNTIDNGRINGVNPNTQEDYSLRIQSMTSNPSQNIKEKRIIMFSAQQMKNKIIMSPSNNGYVNSAEETKEI